MLIISAMLAPGYANRDSLLKQLSTQLTEESTTQSESDWGLALMSFPPDELWDIEDAIFTYYFYKKAVNPGVTVYVLSSGVDVDDEDIRGSVTKGPNFVNYEPNDDLIGDGTSLARLINGVTLGVCKACQVVSIKVTGRKGTKQRDVVKAYQWITKNGGDPSKAVVFSGSHSAHPSSQVRLAESELVKAGYPLFTWADRPAKGQIGCAISATSPFYVAGIDITLNYGEHNAPKACFNILSPGEEVLVNMVDNENVTFASHPSFAAAYVAGLAGYYRTQGIALKSPIELYNTLLEVAKTNSVTGVPAGQPNLLVYNGIF
jgi:hypothetical protein